MKKVITYGTFDLFHFGHLDMLRRASGLGNHLTVAVSTDQFTEIVKEKLCECPYSERAAIVAAIRYVDNVIPESCREQQVSDIEQYDIDVFVTSDEYKGMFDDLKPLCEVIYLPRTAGISTSGLKKSISSGSRDIRRRS